MEEEKIELCLYVDKNALPRTRSEGNVTVKVSLAERLNIVHALFDEGQPGYQIVSDQLQWYGNTIDANYAGKIPAATKKIVNKRFDARWTDVERAADYILQTAQQDVYFHRQDYRPERKMNRDSGVTDIELTEMEDLSNITYFDFCDFVKPLCSTTQVKIATFLFQGFTKTETAASLELSQAQLRTQIKRMAQSLQRNLFQARAPREKCVAIAAA